MAKVKSLYVLVAGGDGWSLWWPSWKWAALTPEEQQQVIDKQRALMDPATQPGQKKKVPV